MQPTNPLRLVTGPSRSGKSEWAETLAMQSGQPVVYIATASLDPEDSEWQARIERHQHRRPSSWQTLCVPLDLAVAIQGQPPGLCILIDSLGSWLTNCLEQDSITWQDSAHQLFLALQQSESQVIIVAEETTWGVVPAYASGRLFRDRLAELERAIAAIADQVDLVVAGYALNLKALGQFVSPIPSLPLGEIFNSPKES
ncbi:MAG: bifunctional adenosylcobinamide kinase/adenosylcobinamide-phosphate guanylyltransferase [Acaryochloridaceae cyanobacterium SU_2_1]|nr:bifunctional adenosylcobinamide kinase/adenosylcobinamide-phosphate guanylyltransferase [Acaryochloridaceae cyanobacterium SU_2_1]